jgi:hypothetical protein
MAAAGPAVRFNVSGPGASSETAGVPFGVTVTATDVSGNIATSYSGTVALTCSDGTLAPVTVAVTNGIGTASVTLDKAETADTLTAGDGTISGVSASFAVSPAALAALTVSAPPTASAGAGFTLTIAGTDAFGNPAGGLVTVSSSDQEPIGSLVLEDGLAWESVVLNNPGTVVITATAAANSAVTAQSSPIAVQSSPAAGFSVTGPTALGEAAGTAFTVTVMALDASGNIATTYNGTVTLTCSDGTLTPVTVTMTNGVGTATVSLDKAETADTLTASDGFISGTSQPFPVSAGPIAYLTLTAPPSVSAGVPFTAVITGTDQLGNPASGWVVPTSSDGETVPYVYLANGQAIDAITLDTAGSDTLTAIAGSVTASTTIAVTPGNAVSFAVSATSSVTAGGEAAVTVTPQDAFGNTVTGYSGAVTLTCSDSAALAPFTFALSGSTAATFHFTLDRAEKLTFTASAGSVQGTSNVVTVRPGPTTSITVSGTPTITTVGTSFSMTVTAHDEYGNATSGNVQLWASNGMTVTPPTMSFTNGAGSASVALTNALVGTQTATRAVQITVSEGTTQATSSLILVNPDWFSENLSDPAIQSRARTDYQRDGSITYSDWLGLFTAAENENPGRIAPEEMASFQTLVANAPYLNMTPSVSVLAGKVINGDPTNNTYNSLQYGLYVQTTALGNLAVGRPTVSLQDMVSKWFLGVNYPDTTINGLVYSYQVVANQPLFAAGESSSQVNYYDVTQGQIGDCWLMASTAEAAYKDPAAIWNMFTYDGISPDNGAAVYTVRFFRPNGTADYLTVDTELPQGGAVFAHPTHTIPSPSLTSFDNLRSPLANPSTTTELWVALLEKAYAQENTEGWLPSNSSGSNSYQALNYISHVSVAGTDQILHALTGIAATGSNSVTASALLSAEQNSQMIVLGTGSPSYKINGAYIEGGHVYAVVGYNTHTQLYTVFNPWGLNGGYGSQGYCAGQFTATGAQLAGDFAYGATSVGWMPQAAAAAPTRSTNGVPQSVVGEPVLAAGQPASSSQPVLAIAPADDSALEIAPAPVAPTAEVRHTHAIDSVFSDLDRGEGLFA